MNTMATKVNTRDQTRWASETYRGRKLIAEAVGNETCCDALRALQHYSDHKILEEKRRQSEEVLKNYNLTTVDKAFNEIFGEIK